MADPSAHKPQGIPAPYRGPYRVGNLFGAPRPADSTDAAFMSIAKPVLRHNPPKERPPSGEAGASDHSGSSGGAAPAGDAALVGAMAARLKQLEDAQRRMKEELIAKDKEIYKLKREAADAALKYEADVAEAQLEAVRLRRQVSDMTAFLQDYGLQWVGPAEPGAASTAPSSSKPPKEGSSKAPQPGACAGGSASTSRRGSGSAPEASAGASAAAAAGAAERPLEVELDFPVLFLRLAQLNDVAGAGKARVVKTRDGAHKLEVPTGLPLAIYRNGYLLGRGPFRRYDDPVGREFLQDVLDGYFPSQFEASHPEGVIFEVRNCLNGEDAKDAPEGWYRGREYFAELAAAGGGNAGAGAGGSGAATGAGSKPNGLAGLGPATLPLASKGAKVATLSDPPSTAAAIGIKEFLSSLPPSVVAGPKGSVVPVRAAIEALLLGPGKAAPAPGAAPAPSSDGFIHVPTYVTEAMETAAAAGTGARLPWDDVVSLRVRGEDGAQTLVIRLRAQDTIGDVRGFVAAYRTRTEPFELRTAFPARVFGDEAMTLKDAGLAPSATLLVKTVAPAPQ